MPQEFQVLRCYQCSTFQVHQVKKANKWSCKMCGEKQSIIKVFGRGAAADCRHHVQRLNTLRGEVEQASLEISPDPGDQDQTEISHQQSNDCKDVSTTGDRWSKFVTSDPAEDDDEDGEIDEKFTTDVAELRQKQRTRKRKRNQREYEDEYSQQSQFVHRSNQNPDGRNWCTRGNNSPEGFCRDVRGSEIKENFGNLGNFEDDNSSQEYFEKPLPKKNFHAMKSVYSFKDLNEGQGHLLEKGGSATKPKPFGSGDQSEGLSGDVPDLTTRQSQGYNPGVNMGQILNEGNTDHQGQDEGQNEGQCLQQFLSQQKKSFDKFESHPRSVITNQKTSKWSKYEDDSDSSEETDTFIDKSVNMYRKVKNSDEDDDGTTSIQSTAMNNECTRTHLDDGSSSAMTSNGENLRQNQHKTGTGMTFSQRRGHVLESNDFEQYSNRQMGDNSYSTNQRQFICENFVKGQENKPSLRLYTALPVSSRNHGRVNSAPLPVSSCNHGRVNSVRCMVGCNHGRVNSVPLPVSSCNHGRVNSVPLPVSSCNHGRVNSVPLPVSSCNHGRVNSAPLPVSSCNHGRVNSVPLQSTSTKSMFVTDDITDEDLML
ncbi:uncharacterized protein [Argopecten irradians]|uniref:uncharacterized protein n=1 Tax=Argopecten irradians TaxID=31199 RepID=UPI00371BC217